MIIPLIQPTPAHATLFHMLCMPRDALLLPLCLPLVPMRRISPYSYHSRFHIAIRGNPSSMLSAAAMRNDMYAWFFALLRPLHSTLLYALLHAVDHARLLRATSLHLAPLCTHSVPFLFLPRLAAWLLRGARVPTVASQPAAALPSQRVAPHRTPRLCNALHRVRIGATV